jgi:hypothetical protein
MPAACWNWLHAQEVSDDNLWDEDIDLVVLQRPEELELASLWMGRRPGVDLPAVDVEQWHELEPVVIEARTRNSSR